MDAQAQAQDSVTERLERSGVQKGCGPKLTPRTSAENWYKKAEANGTIAP